MRIGVSSYSFSQAMADGRMTIMDVIPAAKKMGYDGVEIVKCVSTEEMRALAPQLAQQSKQYDLPIIGYMVGADFLKNDMDAQVEELKKDAEIAALMGTRRMRHDATGGKDKDGNEVPWEQALPILAEGYSRVTEFAAGLGVKTMIENHGYYAQDALRVKSLIEAVNHKNFGWLVDVGNFMCADEIPAESVQVAAPYAVHAHAKDFHAKKAGEFVPAHGWFPTRGGNALRGAMIGHGEANVPECLAILKKAGYDGWLSVEFEGMEDCLMALQKNLEVLRDLV